ncbi:MAG: DUF4230 domain-containing protein [Ruminococcaceae bacterium]|nr:DUF4230 domain-containing protein [Oscillospiraceae bacterium]
MKYIKYITAIILVICTLCLCSCSNQIKEPDEEQIKAICELTTLKCYYNNVAKSTKEKGTGWTHMLEKDRKFWIEYEGFAEIGIDMNDVSMSINENNVIISMPSAKLLNLGIVTETLNENSYITSKDNWWNKNKVTSEEQQAAIGNAQEKMRQTVLDNKSLFNRAENEAKILIENYINNLGKMSGIEYNITWEKM